MHVGPTPPAQLSNQHTLSNQELFIAVDLGGVVSMALWLWLTSNPEGSELSHVREPFVFISSRKYSVLVLSIVPMNVSKTGVILNAAKEVVNDDTFEGVDDVFTFSLW